MKLLDTKGHDEATQHWKHRKVATFLSLYMTQDIVGADLVLWYLNPEENHWTLMVRSIFL